MNANPITDNQWINAYRMTETARLADQQHDPLASLERGEYLALCRQAIDRLSDEAFATVSPNRNGWTSYNEAA